MNQDLENWIEQKLSEGYSRKQITEELVSEGYRRENILQYFDQDTQKLDQFQLPTLLKYLPGLGFVTSLLVGFVPILLLFLIYSSSNTPPQVLAYISAGFLALSFVAGSSLSYGMSALTASHMGAKNSSFREALADSWRVKWRYLKWIPRSLILETAGDFNHGLDIFIDLKKSYIYPVILFEKTPVSEIYDRSSELAEKIPEANSTWLNSQFSGWLGLFISVVIFSVTGVAILVFGPSSTLLSEILAVILVAATFILPVFIISWMLSKRLRFCYVRGHQYASHSN